MYRHALHSRELTSVIILSHLLSIVKLLVDVKSYISITPCMLSVQHINFISDVCVNVLYIYRSRVIHEYICDCKCT